MFSIKAYKTVSDFSDESSLDRDSTSFDSRTQPSAILSEEEIHIGELAPSSQDISDFDEDNFRTVVARGTEDGLILRIDGRAEWREIMRDVELFLGERKKFFEGGTVSIEWLDRLPTKEQSKELEKLLKSHYGIEISPRRIRSASFVRSESGEAKEVVQKKEEGFEESKLAVARKKKGITIPLFEDSLSKDIQSKDGHSKEMLSAEAMLQHISSDIDSSLGEPSLAEAISSHEGQLVAQSFANEELLGSLGSGRSANYVSRVSKLLSDDIFYENDANAKVVFGTLRSGQRIETPFGLIIVGDVNPGADLVAGGDIVVFGSLRGTAHAAAYDDDSYDRVIIALQMQPMQLRIGSVISRGSDDVVNGAEIARIENRRIIVEAFNPRSAFGRRFR